MAPRVLIVDSDAYTFDLIRSKLAGHGELVVHQVANAMDLMSRLAGESVQLAVFNFKLERPEEIAVVGMLRAKWPDVRIVALATRGDAVRRLREWEAAMFPFEAVLHKPLDDRIFSAVVKEMLDAGRMKAEVAKKSRLLHGAVSSAEGLGDDFSPEQVEPFLREQAILVTDARNSTRAILSEDVQTYFETLNAALRAQTRLVEENRGRVIKFTGDGLIASFDGMARTHRALRCAHQIATAGAGADTRMQFGIGVAEGLVLNGLVGMEQRWTFDVIGATVHLAARLCSEAAANEAVFPAALLARSRYHAMDPIAEKHLTLRGFAEPVPCAVFRASPAVSSPVHEDPV